MACYVRVCVRCPLLRCNMLQATSPVRQRIATGLRVQRLQFAMFKPDTQLWALPFVSICYLQVVERYGVVQYIENSRLARLEPASCCVCWNSVEFSQLRSLLPAC
jgi:hypothetical protein